MNIIIQTILAGLSTVAVGIMIAALKWLLSIRKTTARTEERSVRRSKQMQVLFTVQLHQIKAQRTTLEVVSKRSHNGNINAAFKELDAAETKMNEFASKEAWK